MCRIPDEQIESYLKQFRPVLPDSLPLPELKRGSRRRLGLAICGLSAAGLVIVGVVCYGLLHHQVSNQADHFAPLSEHVFTRPLTMRDADAMLVAAPSYKAAMDELAFPRKGSTVREGKQSALAVLGKEKIKL